MNELESLKGRIFKNKGDIRLDNAFVSYLVIKAVGGYSEYISLPIPVYLKLKKQVMKELEIQQKLYGNVHK